MIARAGDEGVNEYASQRPLALDLTEDTVSLMARGPDRTWQVLGTVEVSEPNFLDRIATLRREQGAHGPVDLMLPPDQVLKRSYVLSGNGAGTLFEARERIAAETPYAPHELMISLGAHRGDAPTLVLAALAQTVAEAREYAGKWGFVPGNVTTRVAADELGDEMPVFRAPGPAIVRHRKLAIQAGLAACLGLAALLGFASFAPEFQSSSEQAQRPSTDSTAIATLNVKDDEPQSTPASLRPVTNGGLQALRPHPMRLGTDETYFTLAATALAPVHQGIAPILHLPRTRSPMTVGAAPELPDHARPGRLGPQPVILPHHPVKPPLDISQQLSGQPAVVIAEPVEEQPDQLAAILPDDPGLEDQTSSVFAPAAIGFAPQRKPRAEQQPVADDSTDTPAQTPSAGEHDGPTDYAALTAPRPQIRPKKGALATSSGSSSLSAVTRTGKSPRTVRAAASRSGLTMGVTSLIGVLQGTDGRQAILRLSDGSFRRVRQGDDVSGWQVSTIGRDTLKLTRRGQNRTLVLVTR